MRKKNQINNLFLIFVKKERKNCRREDFGPDDGSISNKRTPIRYAGVCTFQVEGNEFVSNPDNEMDDR